MTSKEIFLSRIQQQIKSLQDTYNYNKDLPDSMFENLTPQISAPPQKPGTLGDALVKIANSIQPFKPNPALQAINESLKMAASLNNSTYSINDMRDSEETKSDYGRNRKLIMRILMDEKKAMLKWDITKRFSEIVDKPIGDVTNVVTNALAGLTTDKAVRGYKPKGLKFKGLFWGLPSWFDGDNILPDFAPNTGMILNW